MKALHHRIAKALAGITLLAASSVSFASSPLACADLKTNTSLSGSQTSTSLAGDGVCLRSFSWKHVQEPVRGVVVIVHGIRDYSLRYDDFATELGRNGFAVFAQDLRGHAYSGGPRQRFDSMHEMIGDVDLIVEKARHDYPGLPVFVYGHSLGGLITSEYALAHADKVSGVILSGAALKRPASVSGFKVRLARVVAAIAPGANVVAIDDHEFSRDKDVMAALETDPLISHKKLPAISAVASIDGMTDVQKKMEQFRVPVLILYGTGDRVNPIEGSQAFYAGVGSKDKTAKAYEGAYHDLLHDPERGQVTADVVEWLGAHAPVRAIREDGQASR